MAIDGICRLPGRRRARRASLVFAPAYKERESEGEEDDDDGIAAPPLAALLLRLLCCDPPTRRVPPSPSYRLLASEARPQALTHSLTSTRSTERTRLLARAQPRPCLSSDNRSSP